MYIEVEGGSDTILTLDGRIVRGYITSGYVPSDGDDAENIGYIPHFVTCKDKNRGIIRGD
jgi:hypothetical protein